MTSVARDIGISEPTDDDVREIMNELDTDNDGSISESEFKVLIKNVLEIMQETY